MVKDIVVIGAGGHCRVLLSILKYHAEFNVAGIVDRDAAAKGEEISGSVIKYSMEELEEIYQNGIRHAAIAIGNNKERKEIFLKLLDMGFKIPSLIHPGAVIEEDAIVGEGSVICLGALIGTKVNIGRNCIVYTGSILDHEVVLEDHSYISPGCSIAGRVMLGESSFIGLGSTIIENITIGKNAVVGAGSVVIREVPENTVVAGVPAGKIK